MSVYPELPCWVQIREICAVPKELGLPIDIPYVGYYVERKDNGSGVVYWIGPVDGLPIEHRHWNWACLEPL